VVWHHWTGQLVTVAAALSSSTPSPRRDRTVTGAAGLAASVAWRHQGPWRQSAAGQLVTAAAAALSDGERGRRRRRRLAVLRSTISNGRRQNACITPERPRSLST